MENLVLKTKKCSPQATLGASIAKKKGKTATNNNKNKVNKYRSLFSFLLQNEEEKEKFFLFIENDLTILLMNIN